mgnify:FL=1
MNMTFNRALETLAAGNAKLAWDIAQLDDGLVPGTTQGEWMSFAIKTLVNRAAQARSDAFFAAKQEG